MSCASAPLSARACPLIPVATDALEEPEPEPDSKPESNPNPTPNNDARQHEASSSDTDDDEALPVKAVPRHRVAPTGMPCLKKGGVSARACREVLSHTANPPQSPSRPLYRPPLFRCYPNRSKSFGCRRVPSVRFDDSSHGLAPGVTHSRRMYDRTPIQSTQGRGSSLDLSLHRCRSICGDEFEEDEDEDEAVFHSPLAIRVAKASAQTDYFGSSWSTGFVAGRVVGFDTSSRIQPLPLSTLTLDTHARRLMKDSVDSDEAPQSSSSEWTVPSIRVFGALAHPALDSSLINPISHATGSYDEDATPREGPNYQKSLDITPLSTPSAANTPNPDGSFTPIASASRMCPSSMTKVDSVTHEHTQASSTTAYTPPNCDLSGSISQASLNGTQLNKPTASAESETMLQALYSLENGSGSRSSSHESLPSTDETSTTSFFTESQSVSGFTFPTTAGSLSESSIVSPTFECDSEKEHADSSPGCVSPRDIGVPSDAAVILPRPGSPTSTTHISHTRTAQGKSDAICWQRNLDALDLRYHAGACPLTAPQTSSQSVDVNTTKVPTGRTSSEETLGAPPMTLVPPLEAENKKKKKKKKFDKRRASLPVLAGFGDDGEGALGGF